MVYLLLLLIIIVVVFSPEYIQTQENLTKILYINDDIEGSETPKDKVENPMDMLDTSSMEVNEDADATAEALLREVKK